MATVTDDLVAAGKIEALIVGVISILPDPQGTAARIVASMQAQGREDPTAAERGALQADAANAASDEK